MLIFQKTILCTSVLKNTRNFACGQYFFMTLAPLGSVDTELSIHTKNSIFYEKSPMVRPFLIAGHIYKLGARFACPYIGPP